MLMPSSPPRAPRGTGAVSVSRRGTSPRLAAAASAALLLLVGLLDYFTGKQASLTLLYLLPIMTAKWFVGRRTARVFCVAAAAMGFAAALTDHPDLPTELWNAGGRLGVYLIFCALLREIRRGATATAGTSAPPATSSTAHPIVASIQRLLILAAGCACALAALGWIVQHRFPSVMGSRGAGGATAASEPQGALVELASLVDRSMRASRPVLLGSRNPQGPSCVAVVKTGELRGKVPDNPGDLNGGPGTTMVAIYCFNRQGNTSPLKDFEWHQGRLRTYLQNVMASNQPAENLAHELAHRAREFADAADEWTEIPSSLAQVKFTRDDSWPGYCMTALDRAIAANDLSATRRWAHELAAAAFSLDDLHHWLDLLASNHLRALDFQQQCQTLFTAAEPLVTKYDPNASISMFPAGILSLNGWGNYYEVERQAEGLFAQPPDLTTQPALSQNITAASVWLTPALRETFVKLQSALTPETQKVWEQAAMTPYEHSYLIGMLYRASRTDAVDDLAAVLKKVNANHPQPSVGELMSVLMYRGHSFAGLEWADRFQPELLEAAEEIPPSTSDKDALVAAADWTNKFYRAPAAGYGMTFTLRDAIEQKKLDCVRATDMIGAIFRNSGRPRFGHVRWCAETNAHSVAAYLGRENDKPKTLLVDGLAPTTQPEVWPDAYFHGHAWPAGLSPTPTPYCVELYVRGLDNYLWAEGYIVRGPNAGMLTTARIPYSTHRLEQSTRKVFEGPYPQ
jgi:hypothetical protein